MLQKGFFITEPFNPSPFWDNTIVNLSGDQKFDEDTVFPAGYYKVDVQAGSGGGATTDSVFRIASRRVIQTFVVNTPFIIRAYCGSKGFGATIGQNPYVGEFKVNGIASNANVPMVSHIFGNAGSAGEYGHQDGNKYAASGGNCLGNGVKGTDGGDLSSGAGSCLHFLPVGGVFGLNYLYAVHIAPGAAGLETGGGGSAYGGAGSGYASSSTVRAGASKDGGSTPFGAGGAGVYASPGPGYVQGHDGTGIGAGIGGGSWIYTPNKKISYGGAAYFDGTNWVDANSNGLFGGNVEDGHIIVEFLRALV